MKNLTRMLSAAGLFSALAITLTFIRVPMVLGNPNLGSTAISVSSILLPPPLVFLVGVIKGVGASIWTGQAIIEMPAGLGDGIMGVITCLLLKKMRPGIAIIVGQCLRYFTTSTPIALVLAVYTGKGLTGFVEFWIAISFPAVTLSIVSNAILASIIAEALRKAKVL